MPSAEQLARLAHKRAVVAVVFACLSFVCALVSMACLFLAKLAAHA